MDEQTHCEPLPGSAMQQATLAGLQRNARVILGNTTAGPGTRAPRDSDRTRE
jgi:hypothetical protein